MFSKRYIFETKTTRVKRWLGNFLIVGMGMALVFLLVCIYLPFHAKKLNEASSLAFFQKAPDLIVVFTGDSGRIQYAVDKAKENKETHLLISGVHAANALKNIVSSEELDQLTQKQVKIDYFARNTHENVLYTLRHIRETKQMNRVLIISSDYHLLRISFLFSQLAPQSDQTEVYLQGTKTDYTQWRNIKILAKETIKLARNFVLLMLWDRETEV